MSDSKYSLELQEQVKKGQRFKYLCFWGHTPKQKSLVDKSCFSQWFSAPFTIDGIMYPTAEHYMMAQKAKLFADDAIFAQILQVRHPNEAKQLGRKVKNYNEQVWQEQRFDIVIQANLAKFSQHPELAKFLLATKERVLVEASPVDRIWGIGLAADDDKAEKPLQWKGLNLLGFALMQVRTQLRESSI